MLIVIGSPAPSSSTLIGAAGSASIGSGVSTKSVVYSSAIGSTSYGLAIAITNTVDATPIFLQALITAKSSTGFTATFNAPTDTANYSLEYIVSKNV